MTYIRNVFRIIACVFIFAVVLPASLHAGYQGGTPVLESPYNNEVLSPDSNVEFIWKSATGAQKYDFYIYDSTTKSYLQRETLEANTICSWEICTNPLTINLSPTHKYHWYLNAKNDTWNSSRVYSAFTFSNFLDNPTIVSPQQYEIESSNQIEFVWEEVAWATSYDFFIYDRPSKSITNRKNAIASEEVCNWGNCTITLEFLAESKNYIWYVRARNVAWVSGLVRTNFHVLEDLPRTPQIISPTAYQTLWSWENLIFMWEESDGATKYNFHMYDRIAKKVTERRNGLLAEDICSTNGICSISTPNTVLPDSQNHVWYLTASNDSGTSPLWFTVFHIDSNLYPDYEPPVISTQSWITTISNYRSDDVLGVTPNQLQTPKLIKPVNEEYVSSNTNIEFTWEVDTLAKSYDFFIYDYTARKYLHRKNGLLSANICNSATCSHSLSSDLEEGHKYRWYVTWKDDTHSSTRVGSNFYYGTYPTTPVLLSPKNGETLIKNNTFDFSWKMELPAKTYYFYTYNIATKKATNRITNVAHNDICQGKICTISIEDFPNSKNHIWYIRAKNWFFTSGLVNWSFHVWSENVPKNPQILSPSYKTVLSSGKNLTFEWEEVPGATKYNFSIYDRVGKKRIEKQTWLLASQFCNNWICSTSTPNTDLSDSINHVWYITAINASGNSAATYTLFDVDSSIVPEAKIEKLLWDDELASTYESFTWYPTTENYFWIYPMLWKGEKLYLGVGTWLPAGQNGAAIVKYSAESQKLEYIEKLNEQWIMSFVDMWDAIGVPWVDPCCGDRLSDEWEAWFYNHQWDWWNFYYLDTVTDSVVKHRNMPYVIHWWGWWYDFAKEKLFLATSNILPDGEPGRPNTGSTSWYIFSSIDTWETWEEVAKKEDGVGNFRTYDIIGHNGVLYAQWADDSSCGIAKSVDEWKNWTRIEWPMVSCAIRLYILWNTLVLVNWNTEELSLVDLEDDSVTQKPLPTGINWSYQPMTQDPYGNAYFWTHDWSIMHTRDFDTWTKLAKYDDEIASFNSIHYWESQDALVMSSWWGIWNFGGKPNLFKLDLKNSDNKGLPDILEQ